MDLELRDRCYLITGGTDGLGLALAKRLVGEGARVAVCGRKVAPPLFETLEVLGRETSLERIDQAIAMLRRAAAPA